MEPQYFVENRYSHLAAMWREPINVDYKSDTPTGQFERRVQSMFFEGQRHLHHEEFALALDTFREMMALILRTADPKMPPDPHRIPGFVFPKDLTIVSPLITRAAKILRATPVSTYQFPKTVMAENSELPPAVQTNLKPAFESEIHVTSHHAEVYSLVESGLEAAEGDDWAGALKHYTAAMAATPAADKAVRASLQHDLAIVNEKLNRHAPAEAASRQSVQLFAGSRNPKGQADALDHLSGFLLRRGRKPEAEAEAKRAAELRKRRNLFPVSMRRPASATLAHPLTFSRSTVSTRPTPVVRPTISPTVLQPIVATPVFAPPGAAAPAAVAVSAVAKPVALMGLLHMPKEASAKTLTIRGTKTSASIVLDGRAATNLKAFMNTLRDTTSIDIITGFWWTPTQTVAYLPHMYFFVIPLAIADCLTGMGNLDEAEEEYLGILAYPFINKKFEIVRWWTRLAELYLEMGDNAYRHAKDRAAGWRQAKKIYEKIVRANGTINPNSPLYKNNKLAAIKNRANAFLQAANPTTFGDNPRVIMKVLRARTQINQIDAGLNFFGFAPDYFPPFSFEYLQNTARYFAQNAAQIEQQHIQYKSTAENEELRREQLDQQAELARQTVVLEQRGVAEANAGIAVAQASLNYAQTQANNAVASRNDFNNARWELLQYAELEAWANAASVDKDDEVMITIPEGYRYYNTSRRRRSLVIQDLAHKRTRLSHDLEAAKLRREVNAANAYVGISQAQARKAVAEQRIQIAQLQQRHAEENRDFVDMKEFSSRLWYELAREARRYLDMAIEIAMLMEKAYDAETERGLRIVRFDYGRTRTHDLLAADRLRHDIDYFTLDLVTTVRTKKAPVKKTISLADPRPMAFRQLKATGQCFFQTELEDFDREHPGLYLCKLHHVELLFVGITGTTSLAGSLRNVGVSKFRRADGSITTRLYPSDMMPLSQYDVRQDALAFRATPNELRLFENNGIDTLWQLDLPRDGNDFDYDEILDVQLVIYYDGFHDPGLETNIRNALPANGTASRGFSLRAMFPDELFYLRNKGEAILDFIDGMFPRNQTNLRRTDVTIQVTGAARAGLTIRLTPTGGPAGEMVLQTDANGEVNDATAGRPLRRLRNRSMIDRWTLKIDAADNAGLVVNGELDLSGIEDIYIFFEYRFDYR